MEAVKQILIEALPIVIVVIAIPLAFKLWKLLVTKVEESETTIDNKVVELVTSGFAKLKNTLDKDQDGEVEVEEIADYIVSKTKGRINPSAAEMIAKSVVKGLN